MNNWMPSYLAYLKDSNVKEAMLYALMAGGKRIRPTLLSLVIDGFACQKDLKPFMIAIEMIHTYSLIHDDLPAMDNDDFRRGKPTCHKVYGEACAILAGDALLTEAFYILSKADIEDAIKIKCITCLSSGAGANGMIYGQFLDIYHDQFPADFEFLKKIHQHKTGMLLSVPLEIACYIARRDELVDTFKTIGLSLGLAFQIQDDILDVTKSSEELGKSTSDVQNDKLTSVQLLGFKQSTALMNKLYQDCIDMLLRIPNFHATSLIAFIEKLRNREK